MLKTNRIVEVLQGVGAILRRPHLSLAQRGSLCAAYLRVITKRFLRRFGEQWLDYRTQTVCGFTVTFDNFEDFYWTFLEIFVREEYHVVLPTSAPTIIDCGGNIGLATLYFKWRWPQSEVTVFEPEPRNADLLKENMERNGLRGVRVEQKAVGGAAGEAVLSGANRAATLRADRAGDWRAATREVTVEVVRLSPYVLPEGLDLLKMDIEGVEDEVLRELAASGVLSRIQYCVFEFHRREGAGEEARLTQLVALLEQAGFTVALPSYGEHHRTTHGMVRCTRSKQ